MGPGDVGPGLLLLLLTTPAVWHGSASPVISPDISALVVNVGDPVLLHCSGESEVKWYPEKFANHTSSVLSIPRTTHRDTGTYRCAYVNSSDKGVASVHLYVRDPSNVWYVPYFRISVTKGGNAEFPCFITAPEYGSSVALIRNDGSKLSPGANYSFSAEKGITLYHVEHEQKGQYQCQTVVNGKIEKSSRIRLIVVEGQEKPVQVMVDPADHVRIVGESFEVTCVVTAPSHKYDIKWVTATNSVKSNGKPDISDGNYIINDTLSIPAVTMEDSGKYTCVANNSAGFKNASTMLRVVERGYVILTPVQAMNQEVAEGDSLQLQVHIEAYPKLLHWHWEHMNSLKNPGSNKLKSEMVPKNNWYNNTLFLDHLEEEERGLYTFYALNSEANSSLTFSVSVKAPPRICNVRVSASDSSELLCTATGYPAPRIEWYQCPTHSDRYEDYELLLNDSSPRVVNTLPFQEVEVESTFPFQDLGTNFTFCCVAVNSKGSTSDILHSVFKSVMAPPNQIFSPILTTCMCTSVLLLLLLLFLLYKYNQKPKYQVRWKIIEACEGNNYIFIDPTQLPYNEKWEFPRNNLQFGKTLGAGAFGKVVEATAFGLGKEDSVLKVAVKMLKSTADTDEQEALMSELKIMSHLGHHENIVNLLGACTYGGPILVITEYCRYGDLLNFLRKKAEYIIIQDSALDTSLDSTADYKNIDLEKKYIRSDSGFASQGLETYVEMRPISSSSSSSASSDSAQSRGKSSEEDESREDLRPLNLSDLLQFSSQVAQGMAFLASKNCIHRDLAARNVLVSDGRVAKICDFGLARDIMNDSNYVVKGNARLPVKWMAPESIFDCIYTVQSDVWSYGILLWEIFSLGKSPYPGMAVNSKFYSMVKRGYQMARPDFAPLEMYGIMQACWSLEPTQRPTFDQICCFIQKELDLQKEQDYTNLPSTAEEDSGCDTSGCCEESCEQEESGQPLLKGNNYQFC
ncbi:macrophage colony-stimulating factor 1 receptor [Centrocercus urophasianus]|uniref:macrophage colony-stimulating factor 1 receptor n=1 Tax=Centrocercus urophasianus TaxID=9002 RepID=UPI001C65229C|nr:macrophage colony-stimulating factor 1 receptor [Centrocercus urophasianus]